jgi:hypothetical protein
MNGLVNPPEGPPVHRALMPVTVELLHEILKLPRETRIVGATLDPAGFIIEFVIEDPRLAPVHEGQEIPQNNPTYVSRGTLHGTLIQAIWKFDQEEVTTGDTLPGDHLTEKEFVTHDHVWGSSETPRLCQICGYPATAATTSRSPRDQ